MYFSIVVLLMFVGLPLFEYTFFIVKLGEQESEKREEKRRGERNREKRRAGQPILVTRCRLRGSC